MDKIGFNSFRLFKKAFMATHREIMASLTILIMMTALFAVVIWVAECRVNEDFSIWDALVWIIVKYVDDPADVATAPVTLLGQFVGTMVGILGIAIFAVPAGLVGSGLLDAMADDKHEEAVLKTVHCCTSASVAFSCLHPGSMMAKDRRVRSSLCRDTGHWHIYR
jgi:voltage-gated potassium channel